MGATHCVPLAKLRQLPEPSQDPSSPHWAMSPIGHWLCIAGGLPAATSEQVPTLPVSAHDWQVPLQAVSQQNPCAQKLELHSLPIAQVTPFCFLPQAVPWHEFGARQSAFDVATVQEVLQDEMPSHRNGAQLAAVGAPQCPAPSQLRGGVRFAVPPGQTPAAHCWAVV